MTLSTSKLAFEDCFALMDAALFDPEGIRVRCEDLGKARYFRLRCHRARDLDRRANLKTYPEDSPLHGRSQYDRLFFRLRDGEGNTLEFVRGEPAEVWVHIDCRFHMPLAVESLSGNRVVLSMPKMEERLLAAPKPAPQNNEDLGAAFDEVEAVAEEKVEIMEPKQGLRRV